MTTNIETIKNNIVELQAEYQSVLKAGTELQKAVRLYDKIESLKLDLANAILGPQEKEETYTVVALSNSWGNEIGLYISDVDDPEQYDDFIIDGDEEQERLYVSRYWHNVNAVEFVRLYKYNKLQYATRVCRFEPGDDIYEDETYGDINADADMEF